MKPRLVQCVLAKSRFPGYQSVQRFISIRNTVSSCCDCSGTAAARPFAIISPLPFPNPGGMVRVSYRRSLSRSVMPSGDSSVKMSQSSRRLLSRSVHFVRVLRQPAGYYPHPAPPPPHKLICCRVLSRDQNTPAPPTLGGMGRVAVDLHVSAVIIPIVGFSSCRVLSRTVECCQKSAPAPPLPRPPPHPAHDTSSLSEIRPNPPPSLWMCPPDGPGFGQTVQCRLSSGSLRESRSPGHRFACVRPVIRSLTGRLSPSLSTHVTKPIRNLCEPNR